MTEQGHIKSSKTEEQEKRTCSTCDVVVEERCLAHPDAFVNTLITRRHMTATRTMSISLNELRFPEADWYAEQMPVPGKEDEIHGPPAPESVLRYLCGEASSKIDKIVERYRESNAVNLQIIPALPFFIDKLQEPLREAQTSYMIGNWMACIALCGVTCEMISMLFFEIHKHKLTINGRELANPEVQKTVLGMEFIKLPQEGKLKFLHSTGVIDQGTFEKLDYVRATRNQYVHFYDYNPERKTQKKEAIEVLKRSTDVAKNIILQGFSDGAMVLNPDMERYLLSQGFLGD